MQAITLCGGRGKRLAPLTNRIPKVLAIAAGKPIIDYHIEWLVREGVTNLILACGYQGEQIREHLVASAFMSQMNIQATIEDEPLGRGGAIKRAAQFLTRPNEPAVLSQGDAVTDIELRAAYEQHVKTSPTITLIGVPYRSRFGVVEVHQDGHVTAFKEKPRLPYWANTGLFIASPDYFEFLPDHGDEDATLEYLAREGRVRFFPSTHYWLSVDTIKDIDELINDLAGGTLPHEESFSPEKACSDRPL